MGRNLSGIRAVRERGRFVKEGLRGGGIALALVLAAGCGFGNNGAARRPNVLLLSVDSLRADHADGMGGTRATGPTLRTLARTGTVFTQATTAAPWTTPSMASVLTGLTPWAHHVRRDDRTLSGQVPTLAERLRQAGYATAAVVPSATLSEEYGFARGFDFFSNGRYDHNTVTSPAMAGTALNWLEHRPAGRPFFLWVHFWDPHFNYLPPAPYDAAVAPAWKPVPGTVYDLAALKNAHAPLAARELEWLRSQYDGELLHTDRYLGEILEMVDRTTDGTGTLVIVLGDHGEAFQEHGWLTHTVRVDEEMVHVPLAFRWTGHLPAGKTIDAPVSLADVAPTVLDMLELEVPSGTMEGGSLKPLIEGAGPAPMGPIVTETVRQAAFAALREGRMKYIIDFDSCAGQMFDLADDPGETRDLSPTRPTEAAAMRERLLRFYRENRAARRIPEEPLPDPSEANRQLLRSLGYLATDRLGDLLAPPHRLDPLQCR